MNINFNAKIENRIKQLADEEGISVEELLIDALKNRAHYKHKTKELERIFVNMSTTYEHFKTIRGRAQ